MQQAMFIGMDPPKHDWLKALFQRGFTPKRIAEHEDAIRAIMIEVLERLEGRETCDLVSDVAQPVPSVVLTEVLLQRMEAECFASQWRHPVKQRCNFDIMVSDC